jgi:hypothetical protein
VGSYGKIQKEYLRLSLLSMTPARVSKYSGVNNIPKEIIEMVKQSKKIAKGIK